MSGLAASCGLGTWDSNFGQWADVVRRGLWGSSHSGLEIISHRGFTAFWKVASVLIEILATVRKSHRQADTILSFGNILCLAECGQCGVRVSSHISLLRHLKQISDTRSQYVFVSFSLSKNKSFCLPTVKYTAKQKPQRTRVVYPLESFMD